jgi:hypothetical protein
MNKNTIISVLIITFLLFCNNKSIISRINESKLSGEEVVRSVFTVNVKFNCSTNFDTLISSRNTPPSFSVGNGTEISDGVYRISMYNDLRDTEMLDYYAKQYGKMSAFDMSEKRGSIIRFMQKGKMISAYSTGYAECMHSCICVWNMDGDKYEFSNICPYIVTACFGRLDTLTKNNECFLGITSGWGDAGDMIQKISIVKWDYDSGFMPVYDHINHYNLENDKEWYEDSLSFNAEKQAAYLLRTKVLRGNDTFLKVAIDTVEIGLKE